MPWYLYIALKQLLPSGRRFPFFTFVSVCGVTLGVALLIIVLSVMNGFGREIRTKIVETQGDVLVQSGRIENEPEALMTLLEAFPEVAAVAPFTQGPIMLQYQSQPRFPVIYGIDLKRELEVVPLAKFLRSGDLDDLDDDSILVSSELASGLRLGVGVEVEVYSPLLVERLKNDEILLPRAVRVVGIFETGWNQIDGNTVIGSLRLMQDLYGLGNGVHGVKLRLKEGVDVDTAVQAINDRLDWGFRALSWIDSNRDFLFVLQLEKNILFFLLLFVVLVSAFAITSSLLITVVRKTREIGLFGALGGRRWQVAACFCLQGLVIGVAGTVLGFGLASVALAFRNDIIHAFAKVTQSEAALLRFYQFADLPSYSNPKDMIIIACASVVISTVAGMIPAWRAARLKPAEALRTE
ncbi:MAG: ABC transporter permease [Verrucomicrobia bacterium]|nr:MAG: ABC transporter permease [Verrucomicrobiota bacterium]